ncbi:hypothetical protein PI95_032190 [Hassallia byssoidea VB512170]|uniref:Uncharacterized protein n=1 Tax=Hassallia byssoidea VB512170 TaxID=1304833 RepID=A0A846HI50_9CYAN|nr:hypothetical protein [Hassalia byssoidea]NEU77035.1 hypothetical protein [Hassalia byssoidea VB512170]
MLKTIKRYLTAVGDQQIIDQRLAELFEIEKVVTIKRAYLGDAEVDDLSVLTKPEQIKLLRALVIKKVASGESAEEALNALVVIENIPPHSIRHDYLYSIPVLSEVGDIIRVGFSLTMLGGAAVALIVFFSPALCKPNALGVNNSQVCNAARAFDKFFRNYEDR